MSSGSSWDRPAFMQVSCSKSSRLCIECYSSSQHSLLKCSCFRSHRRLCCVDCDVCWLLRQYRPLSGCIGPVFGTRVVLHRHRFPNRFHVSEVPEVHANQTCLPRAVPRHERRNLTSHGTSYPLGIWNGQADGCFPDFGRRVAWLQRPSRGIQFGRGPARPLRAGRLRRTHSR